MELSNLPYWMRCTVILSGVVLIFFTGFIVGVEWQYYNAKKGWYGLGNSKY